MFRAGELLSGIFDIYKFMHALVRFRTLILFIVSCFGHSELIAQQWSTLGPDSFPSLINEKEYSLQFANGIGRVSGLWVEPVGNRLESGMNLYLGTPYGGLWKMISGETKWKPTGTDQLMHIGISDFAINSKKTNIRYIATGDPDCIMDPNGPALSSEFCQSRGIVKSIDGGLTWSDTAIGKWYNESNEPDKDFWKYPSSKVARKLLVDPKCSERILTVIHTCKNGGKSYDGMIYLTEDAGATWHLKFYAVNGFLKDLEYKPGSRKVIYTSGRSIYKSTDAGVTWSQLNNNGLPSDTIVKRIELAFAPTAPSEIFALVIYNNARNSDIFHSEDNGLNFIRIVAANSSPEWRTAMVVDPQNAELVYFSAGNRVHRLYKTGDGWRQQYTGGFIHDDVHDLTFPKNGRNLFASTDGGLYSTSDSGRTWENRSKGLNVAECWSVAVSQNGPLSIIAGLQDCGTILYKTNADSSSGWWTIRGGDGMAAAIDYQDEYLFYANDGNNQLISRSIDAGFSWSKNLLPVRSEGAIYQRPFIIDPSRSGVIYTGLHNVYKSVNHGDSWLKYSDFNFLASGEKLVALAMTPNDTNIFYAAFANPAWALLPEKKLYKTEDGGANWIDITKGLRGVSWTNITSIAIHPEIVSHIYVGFRGGWEYKVMLSKDAGSTWVDYSEGLEPDCDVNAIIFNNDSLHTAYIATHHGVYSRKEKDNKWSKVGQGLPRVWVSALDIRFDTQTLYAGTHGRGIWQIKIEEVGK